jgi:hypothetical protein
LPCSADSGGDSAAIANAVFAEITINPKSMSRTAPGKMADFGKEKRRRKCKGELFVAVIPPSLTSSRRICNKFGFWSHEEINFLRE